MNIQAETHTHTKKHIQASIRVQKEAFKPKEFHRGIHAHASQILSKNTVAHRNTRRHIHKQMHTHTHNYTDEARKNTHTHRKKQTYS